MGLEPQSRSGKISRNQGEAGRGPRQIDAQGPQGRAADTGSAEAGQADEAEGLMHPNKVFDWTDRAEMLRFADERAFAHIFTASDEGLFVVHAPVLVTEGGKFWRATPSISTAS